MIRLSLPPYDPNYPVVLSVTGLMEGIPEVGRTTAFAVRQWLGGFVGDVVTTADAVIPAGTGLLPWSTTLEIGGYGDEGWFSIESSAAWPIFITDVIVTYTPPGTDATRAEGHFS